MPLWLRNINSRQRRNRRKKQERIAKQAGYTTKVIDLGVGPDPLNPQGGIYGVQMLVTEKK